MTASSTIRVLVEIGTKRTFASALDWPGWARCAKSEGDALELLFSTADRYARIASASQRAFPRNPTFDVIERANGTPTTDFGAPDVIAATERGAMSDHERTDWAALLARGWNAFDSLIAEASPILKKGPRGGGRDRDEVARHVSEAERAYVRKIGVRFPPFDYFDNDQLTKYRETVSAALATVDQSSAVWPLRYFVRRTLWHIVDHLWEVEDKTE